MSQSQRVFPFQGSDKDYISFLENQLSVALNEAPKEILDSSIISLSGPLATASSDSQPSDSATASSDPQPSDSAIASSDPQPSDYQKACSSFRARDPISPCSTESLPSSTQDDLRILYYDPIHNCDRDLPGNASSTLPSFKQTSITESQGMKELRNFIGDVTGNARWVKRKEELGLCNPETNKATIEVLCGRSLSPRLCEHPQLYPEQYPSEQKTLILRVCNYGALTKERKLQGNLLVHIAKYQQLIFVSLCVVMLEIGIPTDVVDWMMRQYVSDSSRENLRRLRYGCLWVNRCVSKLLDRSWGFRSWEAFLLFPRSIQQYGRFANTKHSCDAFLTDMGTPELALPSFENGFIPYCIPCFIKAIAGQDLKLVDICNSLGYSILFVSPIYETYFNHGPLDFNPFIHATREPVVDFNPFTYAPSEVVVDFDPFNHIFSSADNP